MFIVAEKDIFSHVRYLIAEMWKKHSYNTAEEAEAARLARPDRDDLVVIELKEK